MSDIPNLTNQVGRLSLVGGRLNSAMIICLVTAALAAAGVVITQRLINRNADRLSRAQDELDRAKELSANAEMEKLRQKTGAAEANAANAQQGLVEAQKGLAAAQETAAKAVSDAASTVIAQRDVEVELAKQREKAAQAEAALLQLQNQVRHRVLTAVQIAQLLSDLQRQPKGFVQIDAVLGDGEGLAFANQINSTLIQAGWITSGVNQSAYGDANPVGAAILIHSRNSAPLWATHLATAMRAAGVPIDLQPVMSEASGTARLLIGNKPQ